MVQQTKRRVVISGVGTVAANGLGKEAFWQSTRQGISGIKPLERNLTPDLTIRVAGEVNNFLLSDHIDRKLANRTDRTTHFVFASVREALQDARLNLKEEDPQRVGAVIANTLGGVEYLLREMHTMMLRGLRSVSAYTAIAWLQVANVGQ